MVGKQIIHHEGTVCKATFAATTIRREYSFANLRSDALFVLIIVDGPSRQCFHGALIICDGPRSCRRCSFNLVDFATVWPRPWAYWHHLDPGLLVLAHVFAAPSIGEVGARSHERLDLVAVTTVVLPYLAYKEYDIFTQKLDDYSKRLITSPQLTSSVLEILRPLLLLTTLGSSDAGTCQELRKLHIVWLASNFWIGPV